jgi:hypothetical protein
MCWSWLVIEIYIWNWLKDNWNSNLKSNLKFFFYQVSPGLSLINWFLTWLAYRWFNINLTWIRSQTLGFLDQSIR